MMKKTRRKFDKTFKLEVVKRSLGEDISLKELSKDLSISISTLSRWRKEFIEVGDQLSYPGNGVESLTDDQKENRRLKRALKERELELEILKKAISIFSKKDRIYTNS